jgi:hypothetical protein
VRPVAPWLLALLGVCSAAEGGPRDFIADCAARLTPELTGIKALEEVCPGLRQALNEVAANAPLAVASLDRLTGRSLPEFLFLTAAAKAPAVQPPDPAAVAAILRNLAQSPQAELSWWDRFKAWYLKWLSHPLSRYPGFELPRWLSKLSLPAAVVTALLYTLLGLMVIGVGLIVRNELRAAGILARAARPRRTHGEAFGMAGTVELSLEQVLAAEPMQRPALLFRLLVNELTAQGRLESARGLTHREVAVRARLDDEQERRRFARLSRLAEYQLFGPGALGVDQSRAVLADGQALYLDLRKRPAGLPT